MGLPVRVAAAFAVSGPLASSVEQYRAREGQLQMAAAVAEVMQDGGTLVVEAGTGVGKTFAYLVPALLVFYGRRRVARIADITRNPHRLDV